MGAGGIIKEQGGDYGGYNEDSGGKVVVMVTLLAAMGCWSVYEKKYVKRTKLNRFLNNFSYDIVLLKKIKKMST